MFIHSKKSLGQHFLRNRGALEKIVAAAELVPTDTVLEVGPGEGVLTALILEHAEKVVAVEKDARLIPLLQQKFSAEIASGKLELIHADILNFNSTDYLLLTTDYKLVANLPYYITGQFLRMFLQNNAQPNMMVLLLQKEVAKRIVAADSKESILSISVKCYGMPQYIGTVKAGSFSPPPKVDSAIVAIEDISKDFFRHHHPVPTGKSGHPSSVEEGISEEKFFSILKKGFAHPRKLLASNLGITSDILEKCGVEKKARAENVSLKQWRLLTNSLTK